MTAQSKAKGIAAMLVAHTFFTFAWTCVKTAGQNLPLFEVVFFRAFFSLVILAPFAYFAIGSFRVGNRKMMLLRSLFGFTAMTMSFYAMIETKLGNATTLFNTLPIFMALLAPVFLKEPFRQVETAFVVSAFVGVALIVKPDTSIFSGVSVIALLAGFLAACAMICIRKMTATDSPITITFYFTVLIVIGSAPLCYHSFVMPTAREWLLLAAIGALTTVAQLIMAKSYQLANASAVAPFSYFSSIGTYISGFIFFKEIPDIYSIAGAALVIISGICIMIIAPKVQVVPETNMKSAIGYEP